MALPNDLDYKAVIKALEKAGFKLDGGLKNHLKFKRPRMSANDMVRIVIVPMHKEIATGTLRSIVEQSGISREEFLKLL